MTSEEIIKQIADLKRSGRLPLTLTKVTEDKMAEAMARYFTEAAGAKVQEFADKALDLAKKALANIEVGGVEKAQEAEQPDRILLRDFVEGHGVESVAESMNMELFLRVPREVAYGAGEFIRQNESEEELDEYPALELVRGYARLVPRGSTEAPGDDDWPTRWEAAGGELVDGRMVALKSDDVWQALGEAEGYDDGLGNPFPPFAFNSGMEVSSVSRKEAQSLGLLDEGEEAQPAQFDFKSLFPSLEARMGGAVGIQKVADAYFCGDFVAARLALTRGVPITAKAA